MEGTSESPVTTAEISYSRFDDRPQSSKRSLRSYPAIVHVAFISTLLLPIAIIPYFFAKKNIVVLQRKVQVLEQDIGRLRNDLDVAISNQRSTSSELRLLQASIHKTLKGSNALRDQVNRQEADRIATNQETQKNLRELLNDAQHSRYYTLRLSPRDRQLWKTDKLPSSSQMTTLYPLGRSLADIAAFMQEIETRLGLASSDQSKDQRGIERLRLLALRLHLQSSSRRSTKHEVRLFYADSEESRLMV